MSTRVEHLAWCKERALAYVERGELSTAWSSFISDMSKDAETAGHQLIVIGTALLQSGKLDNKDEMKKFIEDFN